MRTITFVLALAVATLAGCGGKQKPSNFSTEELETNPAANFVRGVEALRTPDRKTGAVDYAGALAYFEKAAMLGAGAKANYNAGWTAEQTGDIQKAEENYRKAVEADPAYDKALFSLTRVLASQGKHAEAVPLFKQYADAHPEDPEAKNDYVAALIRAGQYDLAIADSQDILRKDPKNAGVYRNLSALYYAQGNYGMSQLTAEKALSLNDGDPGTYNNMGVTYLIQGDEPAAIEKFKTALKLDPKNYEANMNLGFVSLASGDYKLAGENFAAALSANPSSLQAKTGMAVAQRGLGDYKAADDLYSDVIKAEPNNRAAYFNASTLHEKYTKDFTKALKYLEDYRSAQAGTLSPTDEVFTRMERVNLAKAAEEEKKRIEAEKKKAEEERKARNEKLLADIATTVKNTQAKLEANAACIDPMFAEEVKMMLEQAQMVVDAQEVDMATDIQTLLDGYLPTVDEFVAACASGAAPPPAEGGEPAPEGEVPAEPAPEGSP